MLSSPGGSFWAVSFIALAVFNLVEGGVVQPRAPFPELQIRQTNGTYTPVTGCRGGVVDRRDINELEQNDPDVFSMYVLALRDLQDDMENEDTSWYQVSGIHGFPYESWQEDDSFTPANPNMGYCTHRSGIFTTWHRPYLLLLEQLLCEKARDIAGLANGTYGERRWQAAADRVRLPYWDWSASESESRIPDSVKSTSITVEGPAGSETFDNPLYNYDFLNPQPPNSGLGTQTIRSGSEDDLVAGFENRRLATLNLFTVDLYNQFSVDLESIHNNIHVEVGGDMGFVPRSAFDPIFYLHHTNVDRLMAMYQATHPGVVLTPRDRSPTYALGGPGPDDLNTRLYPFRHPDLTGWTSNDVSTAESIFEYGYSYPEVPQGLSEQELIEFTTERVNALYAPQPEDEREARIFSDDVESGIPDTTTSRREWSCNVQVDTTGLVGSYRLVFYIGDEPTKGNMAGSAAIFANPDSAVENPNSLVNVTVPLTPTLLDKDVALSPNNTVSTLQSELNWVVERKTEDGLDSVEVDPTELGDSLVISVISNEADYPEDKTKLPTKGEPVTFVAPTEGKTGGLQSGDSIPVGTKVETTNGTAPAVARRRLSRRSVQLI